MGTFSIISDASTVILYNYCFEGIWDENDGLHNCPGTCGQVNYIDVNGNPQTEYGISVQSGIISIEAQSITSTVGVQPVTCIPE